MGFLSSRCEEVACNSDGLLLVDGSILVVRLTRERAQEITERQARELSLCYVNPAILLQMAQANGTTRSAALEALLPDAAHIRSGDFGEILCRELLRQTDITCSFPVLRWRNRSSKNDTVRGTDLIGYAVVEGEGVNEDDVLILCEVKTRSATVKNDVVLDALDGVKKDYASRMASSLHFQQARLIQDALVEEAKRLGRFISPHNTPYKKRLVAVVVHANHLWQDAFLNVLPNSHGEKAEVSVRVVRIDDLATWINEVYAAAVALADQDA